jgi:predicted amidophosphoribosyltransferase
MELKIRDTVFNTSILPHPIIRYNQPMSLIKSIYTTFVDALFPIPKEELWILNTPAQSIFSILPRDKYSPIPDGCAIFSYKDERAWRLVWSIKYKKSAQAVALAGYALHKMLSIYALATSPIVVIPMPVSKQRRRERGFNQCELLANEIDRLENLPSENTTGPGMKRLIIINDLFIRTRHTSRLTLKDKKDRQETAHDLFSINEKFLAKLKTEKLQLYEIIKNPSTHFIIIDDVITTGSTMKEAVETMRKAGFTNTWGLSVAH